MLNCRDLSSVGEVDKQLIFKYGRGIYLVQTKFALQMSANDLLARQPIRWCRVMLVQSSSTSEGVPVIDSYLLPHTKIYLSTCVVNKASFALAHQKYLKLWRSELIIHLIGDFSSIK